MRRERPRALALPPPPLLRLLLLLRPRLRTRVLPTTPASANRSALAAGWRPSRGRSYGSSRRPCCPGRRGGGRHCRWESPFSIAYSLFFFPSRCMLIWTLKLRSHDRTIYLELPSNRSQLPRRSLPPHLPCPPLARILFYLLYYIYCIRYLIPIYYILFFFARSARPIGKTSPKLQHTASGAT